MADNTQTLDEILRNMQFEDIENMNRKQHLESAKQAILQWVADEVCSINYPLTMLKTHDPLGDHAMGEIFAVDRLQSKQRDILKAHGYKGEEKV